MLEAAEVSRRRRRGGELAGEEFSERLVVLSTFNLDLLPPFLLEALERRGVPAGVALSGFGQLAQEIVNPGSQLYADEPAGVLLVPSPEDLLANAFAGEVTGEEALALADERAQELRGQVETVLERLPATTVYLVAFGAGRAPVESVLDPSSPRRGQQLVERFDAAVRGMSSLGERVVVVDWDWHARRHGRATLFDPKLWYLGRMRLSRDGLAEFADVVAGSVAAFKGAGRKKVAALDLDDTLWGGIVGEAGVGGLELGEEGLGLAFQDFQRELLKLHRTGVVLVICTKNNRDDALAGFEHPGMVLKREHFSAERINWQDKATNLREIADELSLGMDSFVFLDDNPVERDWVRQALPEVTVPELPADPVERPGFLASAEWFRVLDVTEADEKRAASYRSQGERKRAAGSARSFEDFLESLEQRVTIEPLSETTLARGAQLSQRTNQFNLTTRRHTAADLERMMGDDSFELYTLAVADRYGDSGITGLAILEHGDGATEIDTLLLSCRVLGRRVEDAFLAFLAERAKARGARALVGRFERSERNAQAERFYPERGFAEDGEHAYRLDLESAAIESPPQIAVNQPAHA